jgi:hypothetical protein
LSNLLTCRWIRPCFVSSSSIIASFVSHYTLSHSASSAPHPSKSSMHIYHTPQFYALLTSSRTVQTKTNLINLLTFNPLIWHTRYTCPNSTDLCMPFYHHHCDPFTLFCSPSEIDSGFIESCHSTHETPIPP